jgi:hypothetical protein
MDVVVTKKQLANKKTIIQSIFVLSICFGVFICGCCNPNAIVKVYDGNAMPDSETTLLKCDYQTFVTDVYGTAIRKIWDSNNTLIWEGNARTFRLMPGIYSFEAYYDTGDGSANGAIAGAAAGYAHQTASQNTTSIIKAKFDVNKEYILKCKKTGLFVWQWKASYWIEDLQSGEVVWGTKPEGK